MLSQSQVLFVTSEMQTKLHCFFGPKYWAWLMFGSHNGVIHFSPVFFARIDVISFHGILNVLEEHENVCLFISRRGWQCLWHPVPDPCPLAPPPAPPPTRLKFNDSIRVVSISSRNNLIRSQGSSVAIKAQYNPERKHERDMKGFFSHPSFDTILPSSLSLFDQ